jgi:hypothetical protein
MGLSNYPEFYADFRTEATFFPQNDRVEKYFSKKVDVPEKTVYWVKLFSGALFLKCLFIPEIKIKL